MVFDVTVVGSAGTHPGPGRACSGYLFHADGTRLLVDCGNGSTANLQRLLPFDALDAVLITHRHADHCVDLIGMFYALRFHPKGPRRMPLYAAPEVAETLTVLLSRDSAMEFAEVFPCTVIRGGDRFELGPMTVELFDSVHPAPTVSVRISCEGRVAVYSSDSAGGPELIAAARDADLFLCEATWQGDPDRYPPDVHLTARGAGEVASAAGVDRLVLTHLLPTNDRARAIEEAGRSFHGEIALAEDNQTWTLR